MREDRLLEALESDDEKKLVRLIDQMDYARGRNQCPRIENLVKILQAYPAHKESIFQKIKQGLRLEGLFYDYGKLVELYPEHRKDFFQMMQTDDYFNFSEREYKRSQIQEINDYIKIFPEFSEEVFNAFLPHGLDL